jgi:hypothetical protein
MKIDYFYSYEETRKCFFDTFGNKKSMIRFIRWHRQPLSFLPIHKKNLSWYLFDENATAAPSRDKK